MTINGPYGDFYLRESDREIVFVAGGSGMAPIKSMLLDMAEKGSTRKATYFFGARAVRDLFLVDEMRALEKRLPNFRFVPALSSPLPEDKWEGETGLITDVLARHYERMDHHEAYLCGSPGMIDAAIKVFKAKGLPDELTFFDELPAGDGDEARHEGAEARRMKQTVQMQKAQERMAPGVITRDGFLGDDRRPLADILLADDAAVKALDLEHEAVARRMIELRDAGMAGLGEFVDVAPHFEVRVDSVRGQPPVPLRRPGHLPQDQHHRAQPAHGAGDHLHRSPHPPRAGARLLRGPGLAVPPGAEGPRGGAGARMTDTLALFGGPKTAAEPFPAWPRLSDKAQAEAAAVLASGRLVQSAGTRVAAFEAAFAAWVGVPHAVAVANGTAALHAALAALGIGPGDEVIVPSHTFVATPLAVLHAGARPVFCDVTDDQTIDPRAIDELATARTRAVIAVHLYGVMCDMDRILERSRARGIAVIEDCAQALGGEWQGRRAGTLGDAGCFSFSQVKHLTTAGEGGMVTTARERRRRARPVARGPRQGAGRGRRRAAAREAGVELPPHRGPGRRRAGRAGAPGILEPCAPAGFREGLRPRLLAASGREGRAAEHGHAPQRLLDLPPAAGPRAAHLQRRPGARGARGRGHPPAAGDRACVLRGARVRGEGRSRGRRGSARALPDRRGAARAHRSCCTCTPRGTGRTSTWSPRR